MRKADVATIFHKNMLLICVWPKMLGDTRSVELLAYLLFETIVDLIKVFSSGTALKILSIDSIHSRFHHTIPKFICRTTPQPITKW